ncbi:MULTISPECIES: hypothetical protein [unclassified Microbacterium]|uniref:hypothetical protein n=1 Tax=unclassified Microbacterium TaxID=2609290 RepID=UPI0012FA6436|nr:hypothetical protein [Microbacterium sp. MAH-37]MVQ41428.1 hypothetical protein [Microbacterium sp. MAH-37]
MLYADVTTPSEAEALATRILTVRQRPLVLVSATAEGEFAFDDDRLRHELGGIADVVTIATGRATHALEELLPPKTHAFGGAARSYPVDFGDDPDWSRSRLRFPGHADTDDLIGDAKAQSVQQVRRTVESSAPNAVRRASGVVKGFLAGDTRALVELDDGTTVTATGDLLPATLPLAVALVPGAPVSGILERQELHPEPFPADLSALPDGAHTLALVVKVTDLRATVHLHPDHAFVLRRRDVSADERPVGDVLAVGDVIRVRVAHGPHGEVLLSHSGRDDSAPLTPAFPLVTGGPAWLSEDRRATRSDAAEPAAAAPASAAPPLPDDYATRTDVRMLAQAITALRGDVLALTNLVGRSSGEASPAPSAELERLRAENAQLRAEIADERAERARAEARLSETSQDQRDSARALRDARRAAERAHVDPTEDGIRFEIERTWGNRTAPGERGRWPLREFRFGPDFIRSLAKLDENQLSKAVRACVDAITGRDREIPARDLHRLRTGEGGDDAYVVRADGAKCWRAAIEQNTPGARRLHYWELPGDLIELSRIVTHDDTRP